jgi:acetyltransferase-like isoleucine patch superfamily enzyme
VSIGFNMLPSSGLASFLRNNEGLYLFIRGTRMRWRRFRRKLKHVHPTAYVAKSAMVHPSVVMGPYAFVNEGGVIGAYVEIGKYAMLGPRVAVVGADHHIDQPGVPLIFTGRPDRPKTVIGDDCWIGFGAIIMAGVTIGRGAVVASGAVVTKDVPPYEVHAGVPAKKLRDRFAEGSEERRIHDEMLARPASKLGTFCRPRA